MKRKRDRPPARPQGEEAPAPSSGQRWVRSQQPILEDGQLGGANLDRGPERRNPEGTVDTPNPTPDAR